MINKICNICKKEYIVHKYRKDTAKYCSKQCRQKATGIANKGSKSHFYKTGWFKTSQGYLARSLGTNKTELQHRVVMEQHLGRKLVEGEDIHHLNGNKTDNRIDNLQLLTHSEHLSLHTTRRWREDGGIYAI